MILPLDNPPEPSALFGIEDPRAAFGKHAGIDWPVGLGTPVVAPVSGTVTDYVYGQYHGKTVQIYDGKLYYRLMHMTLRTVTSGDQVKEGDQVGNSGATGEGITGPHLHFDVSPDKYPKSFTFIDPLSLLKEEEMLTTRDDSILLWRTTLQVHSPTEAQKRSWTGRNLTELLTEIYASDRFKALQAKLKAATPTAVVLKPGQTYQFKGGS